MNDQQIENWREVVRNRPELADDDVTELEDHLHGQMGDLKASGLAEDEAFLVAVKRMGSVDEFSREFAREHSERLWNQLVLSSVDPIVAKQRKRDRWMAIALGIGAALSVGAIIAFVPDDRGPRMIPFFSLPWLAAYFAWKRELSGWPLAALITGFGVTACVLTFYPFIDYWDNHTLELTILHAIVLHWALIGLAYCGGEWRSSSRWLDFIRFTGEWAVCMLLIGCVIGPLLFLAERGIDLANPSWKYEPEYALFAYLPWILGMGLVLIAAWLVESKQNVIENIAPVLARVFSPVTVILLISVLVAFAVSPGMIWVNRDLLILMTAILLAVFALWLYAVSARPPQAPAGLADWLQLVLIVSA
ncbi:MAG TPA: permease prefix domain 1-containing protein, partial [Marmoricola sp.]|nr:permease prefix domain 1-containing protein [Marmoricola sp.]